MPNISIRTFGADGIKYSLILGSLNIMIGVWCTAIKCIQCHGSLS